MKVIYKKLSIQFILMYVIGMLILKEYQQLM